MPNILTDFWKAINPPFRQTRKSRKVRKIQSPASPPMRFPTSRINKTARRSFRQKQKEERLEEIKKRVAERKLRELETLQELSPRKRQTRTKTRLD